MITHFISTLAYNLAFSVPDTRPCIENVLRQNRYLDNRSLETQFQKLIIEPMQSLTQPRRPTVIIVDALDECDDRQMVAEFIGIVAQAFRDHQLFLRFFFTSRVEEHIRSMFATSPALDVTYCLNLHDFNAGRDIHTFFRSRFATIYQQKHRLMRHVSLPWPSESDLDELVEKSSESFIFAFTLVNFVNDGSDLPHRKLRAALQTHSGLDPLYTQVLQSAPRGPYFTGVLETIITIAEPVSIMDLACLLQVEGGDVIHALQGVQSIIMVPEDDEQPVRLFHTSLRDFLTSRIRSGSFFINPVTSHLSIAADCLAVMVTHRGDIIYDIEMLEYAARSWCHHLLSAIKMGDGSDLLFSQDSAFGICTLTDFVSGAFDSWINSILLQGEIYKISQTLKLVLEVSILCLWCKII
jgi:hypothetical protein